MTLAAPVRGIQHIEYQYLDLLKEILAENEGVEFTNDRTGTGTIGVFGRMLKHDMSEGFPALTTKKLAFKMVKAELFWFLAGRTDLEFLHEHGCHIWDKDAARNGGQLGPIYGKQWRRWTKIKVQRTDTPIYTLGAVEPDAALTRTRTGVAIEEIDQIKWVVDAIKKIADDPTGSHPEARRLIVSAWNVADLEDMALPPCHGPFQFQVKNGKLNLVMWQRSADMFLGVPFNIASYALLLHMVAHVTGLEAGTFTHYLNDAHIYRNLVDQVQEQLTRDPLPLPQLWLNPDVKDIFAFTMDDIKLVDYKSHAAIKGEMSS